MSWLDELQPASWRGIYFAVMDSEVRRGRRVAVHEYPYRDVVWVEDLGLATRRYGFRAFYVGDDCYDHEQSMLDAAETPGVGTLVHPSLGSIQVNLVEFSSGQRRELGRVIEYQFGFIEGSPGNLFPASADSTQDTVGDAADDADSAASGDFGDAVASALATGADAVGAAVSATQAIVNTGLTVVSDASRLAGSINGLGPALANTGLQLGRFAGGNVIYGPTARISSVLASVSGLASGAARVEAGATAAIASAITLGQTAAIAGNQVLDYAAAL